MWKRLDESIGLSEKHARLSWPALGVWLYLLPNTDSKGRYPADVKIIKARCMTYREEFRLEQVEAALQELSKERVLHLYHSGEKRYLVLHDHDQWNPTGALRYQGAKYPEPPPEACECQRRESGVKTPPVSLSSSSTSEGVQGEHTDDPPPRVPSRPVVSPRDEVLRQLFALAKNQKVAATDATLRNRLDGWVARIGAQEVQARLMDPSTVAKTVIELQDMWFPKVAQRALAPAPKSFKCGTCQDSGFTVDPRNGTQSPCSCQRRRGSA